MTIFNSFETKAVRQGSDCDPINGSIIPGIFQTSTYVQPYPNKPKGFDYTRCKNPTRSNLEECLSSLEGSKYGVCTASGLSAITCVFNLLKYGANIVIGKDVYGGVYRLLSTIFEDRYNVKWVDATNIQNIENACKEFGKVDLIWVEALSNPLLKVTDIVSVSSVARQYNALTCVDSTFLTPYLQKPLELGADIVMHSLTKYINGHSDVVAGGVFTNSQALYEKLFHIQKTLGPSLSPFDSWLVLRGVKTLSIRMEQRQNNANKVASYLQNHWKVKKVLYPAGSEYNNYNVLKSQTTKHFSGGGIISFYVNGKPELACLFVQKLQLFQLAESLGGVESLSCIPALMTHASVPKEIRDENGVTTNLIRLSVGIEGVEDLIADLDQAFSFI